MPNYTPNCLAELEYLYNFFKENNKEKILSNFCNELLITGWNVCKASKEYGVTPHVFNENMLNLYKNSDAFIYECTIGGIEFDKINKDKFIVNYINENYSKKRLYILCYGDGIGLDSQTHAENGHHVTYFDFEGSTSNFAQHRIYNVGLIEDVKFVFKEEEIHLDYYDIVICREVLEHLESPIDTMEHLRKYLNKDGICFLSESFSRVEKKFPTHLASNLKYVGKTIKLMVKIGFRYIDRFEDSNLLVFKKTNINDEFRFETIPTVSFKRRFKKRLKDLLMYYLS